VREAPHRRETRLAAAAPLPAHLDAQHPHRQVDVETPPEETVRYCERYCPQQLGELVHWGLQAGWWGGCRGRATKSHLRLSTSLM
jgi:hypothetical protein